MGIGRATNMLKEAKQSEMAAVEEYEKNPTLENEVAMMEAKYIVVLVIALYLLAALLPDAISALNGANTTGWTATQIAIWSVLSIVILAVVIIKLTE